MRKEEDDEREQTTTTTTMSNAYEPFVYTKLLCIIYFVESMQSMDDK